MSTEIPYLRVGTSYYKTIEKPTVPEIHVNEIITDGKK